MVGNRAMRPLGVARGIVSGLGPGRNLGPARLVIAAAAIFGSVGLLGSCSSALDTPTAYPAIHDMPPPRPEAPMSQQQLKDVTSDLLTERNKLDAEAKPTPPASIPAKGLTSIAARKKPAKPAPTTDTATGYSPPPSAYSSPQGNP